MKTYSTYYSGIIQTTRQNQAKIDMNNIYLPLHVWDREFDSRLAVAYLEACKGNRSIIGHEYNIAPCYKHDHNALLFRAGQPLDHSIRGNWHKEIKDRGGIVITHDEEGIKTLICKVYKTKTNLNLDKINNSHKEASHLKQADCLWITQSFQCHQISNIEPINRNKQDCQQSSVRFDLLGDFVKNQQEIATYQ